MFYCGGRHDQTKGWALLCLRPPCKIRKSFYGFLERTLTQFKLNEMGILVDNESDDTVTRQARQCLNGRAGNKLSVCRSQKLEDEED